MIETAACGLSRRAWSVAAFGAFAFHAACAAAIGLTLASEEADASLGAPGIEIAVELSAPRVEPSDLPPGPEAEDSVASPAVPEQKAEVEKTDLPKATPTETEDPDRVVAPDSTEKPVDEPTKATVTTKASVESIASEAAAPPAIENVKETPESAAPVQGTGESARLVRAGWQKELGEHIKRHLRYPSGTARRSEQVVVRFTLDRIGHVVDVSVVKGSGDPAFDAAAIATMRRSDPVPAPPPRVADDGLTFTIPVNFRVRDRG